MRCKAKYIGTPRFGVERGQTREIEVCTISSEYGTPYLWVRTGQEYMMPYVSILALLSDWQFIYVHDLDADALSQEELTDRWLEIYMPDGADGAVQRAEGIL